MNLIGANNIVGSFEYNSKKESPLGNIFEYNSFSNLNDFQISGTSTISIVSNYINLSNGSPDFGQYIVYNGASPHKITCLEKWKQRLAVRTPTINGGSFGIGIGVQSLNNYDSFSTFVRWGWDTGFHNVFLYTKNSIPDQLISAGSFTPTSNTDYIIEVERNKNVITYTIFNTSLVQLFTTTFTIDISTVNYKQVHNTGRFAIQNFAGTNIRINSWIVSSTANRYCDYIALGDSNMYGMFAGSNANRFVEQSMLEKKYSYEVLAGIADQTREALLRVDEIINLRPKNVFISLLRNDIAAGRSSVNWQADYNAIISRLEAAGIRVKLSTPIASNVDVSAGATFVNGKSGYQIADFYTSTKSAGTTLNAAYNSGDAIHLNLAGNNQLKTTLNTIL